MHVPLITGPVAGASAGKVGVAYDLSWPTSSPGPTSDQKQEMCDLLCSGADHCTAPKAYPDGTPCSLFGGPYDYVDDSGTCVKVSNGRTSCDYNIELDEGIPPEPCVTYTCNPTGGLCEVAIKYPDGTICDTVDYTKKHQIDLRCQVASCRTSLCLVIRRMGFGGVHIGFYDRNWERRRGSPSTLCAA
eukprot:SM000069S20750  [mRNA]  locus=s69:640163:643593:- [translate_table: standard]